MNANHLVCVYPVWWWSVTALMKRYFEIQKVQFSMKRFSF
ncbi:hypothetical protein [Catalinimonas locisalis]